VSDGARRRLRIGNGKIQQALKRSSWYQRTKTSFLYDAFWNVVDREVIAAREHELCFYRKVLVGLKQGDLVFDLGANTGFKTDIFLRLGARVIAVEPDAANQKLLNGRFFAHRIASKPVAIIGKAISDRVGTETLWMHRPGDAHNTLSGKSIERFTQDPRSGQAGIAFECKAEVETITLDELISDFGVPFFIKIDVEGYEAKALMGLSSAVPYLSFEINLPEFKPEGLACIGRLEYVAPYGLFNFVRGDQCNFVHEHWFNAATCRVEFERWNRGSIEVFWSSRRDPAAVA
jgi:FkbM family methyltransferase